MFVAELIPEMSEGKHSNIGTIFFAVGFSVMMILDHRPGALYKVLARLYTLGINVTKLESRPIPDREFEFMFYFDLETSIYSAEFIQLMCELDELCEEFKYLGSYTEVV